MIKIGKVLHKKVLQKIKFRGDTVIRSVAFRFFFFALMGFCLVACGRKQDLFCDSKVIAKVDGMEITDKDLKQYYQTLTCLSSQEDSLSSEVNETLKKALLEKLIERKVLLREAAKRGIRVDPRDMDRVVDAVQRDYGKAFEEHLAVLHLSLKMWQAALRRNMMIEKLVKKQLSSVKDASDDEIRKYYRAHQDAFLLPRQYCLAQIVVLTEKMAGEIRDKLLRGESFTELAKRYSISPDGRQGGELGYWREDYLPAEFEGVRGLKIGETGAITHSSYGYHIVKLLGIRPARTISLKEAGPQIARKLQQARREEKRVAWVDELKKRSNIIRYYDILRTVKLAGS